MIGLYCATFTASAVVSLVLTWLIRNAADRYDLARGYYYPHHIHRGRISRLGGLAVFATFVGMAAFFSLISAPALELPSRNALKLLPAACCIFAIGLIDDFRGLGAKEKLLGQIGGGLCLYIAGFRLFEPSLHSLMWFSSVLSLAVTVAWVVLVSNSINLIDGLDGLAASVSLSGVAAIVAIAALQGLSGIALTALVIAGALAGFLCFNSYPASIFLGDSGSLFLGLVLSGLTIRLSQQQPNLFRSSLIAILPVSLPLIETATTILRRFLNNRPIFQADRNHIHHRLISRGLSQLEAVLCLCGGSLLCIVTGLAVLYPFLTIPLLGGIVTMLSLMGLAVLANRGHVESTREQAPPAYPSRFVLELESMLGIGMSNKRTLRTGSKYRSGAIQSEPIFVPAAEEDIQAIIE